MKKIITSLLFVSFCVAITHAQTKNDLRAKADSAVKVFTWDVKKEEKGSIMFLDVSYGHGNKTEYLTLTVAKDKTKLRPDFLSVIIPSDVDQSNGIFMTFARTVTKPSGERSIEFDNAQMSRLSFEKCTDQDCVARVLNCFVDDKESSRHIDVLKNMLEYDHIAFLFLYKDGSHQSVLVPLFTFKEQYKNIQ